MRVRTRNAAKMTAFPVERILGTVLKDIGDSSQFFEHYFETILPDRCSILKCNKLSCNA